jgi:hypothetical protein
MEKNFNAIGEAISASKLGGELSNAEQVAQRGSRKIEAVSTGWTSAFLRWPMWVVLIVWPLPKVHVRRGHVTKQRPGRCAGLEDAGRIGGVTWVKPSV